MRASVSIGQGRAGFVLAQRLAIIGYSSVAIPRHRQTAQPRPQMLIAPPSANTSRFYCQIPRRRPMKMTIRHHILGLRLLFHDAAVVPAIRSRHFTPGIWRNRWQQI